MTHENTYRDNVLHVDCKHENIGTNDNDLIKTNIKQEKHVK